MVAKERIELLCHTINRVANEEPWFHTTPEEFQIAVEAALQASDLPESWVQAASTPEMIAVYQQRFKSRGVCLVPDELHDLFLHMESCCENH